MKKNIMKAIVLIGALFIAFILLHGCGTKSKSKTTSTTSEKMVVEAREKDSISRTDKLITQKVEEKLSEYFAEKNASQKEKETNIETVETIEYTGGEPLIIESDKGTMKISGNGTLTRTTKKVNKELSREEVQKINQDISERIESKIDEENISILVKSAVRESLSEIDKSTIDKSKEVETSGLGFWFWFWLILVLVLIVAVYASRKWLSLQFPFLKFLNF